MSMSAMKLSVAIYSPQFEAAGCEDYCSVCTEREERGSIKFVDRSVDGQYTNLIF